MKSFERAYQWQGPYYRRIVYRNELTTYEWRLVLEGKHPIYRLMPCAINEPDLLWDLD